MTMGGWPAKASSHRRECFPPNARPMAVSGWLAGGESGPGWFVRAQSERSLDGGQGAARPCQGGRAIRADQEADEDFKYGADELLTLDDAGFASLNLSLQVAAP